MNFKNAKSKIMFKIFLWISIIGFFILGCTVDVEADGMKTYICLVLGWFLCVFITVLLYDYKMVTRRFFALGKVVKVLYGYWSKNRSEEYIEIYEAVIEAGSLLDYYKDAMEEYDWLHNRKVQ